MKKTIILVLTFNILFFANGQVYKTVNIPTPGTISTLLNDYEKVTVTNLTIVGNIDARDIRFLRSLPIIDLNLNDATINAYTGKNGTIGYGIDSQVYPANELPNSSFFDSSFKIKTIILPKNLLSIGNRAFYQCRTLTDILIPNTVINIGSYAFYSAGLSGFALFIPKSVRTIGNAAFEFCGISSVTFENSNPLTYFTSIGVEAFYFCGYLTTLTLSNAVTSIGDYAFSSCSKLTTIYSNNLTPPKLLETNFSPGTNCFPKNIVTNVFVSSIDAVAAYKANTDWFYYFPGNIIKKGSPIANNPTSANINKVLTENQSLTFKAADFVFNSPISNALKGIKILSLPTVGTLKYSGTNVAINGIIGNPNLLVYTATNTATNFTFKVIDSADLISDATYTVSLNVVSVNPVGSITVSFKKPTDWGTGGVSLWAWTGTSTNLFSAWPGITMTDNGNGWFSYTFASTINNVNVVFSNAGSPQTVDILGITQNTCYEAGALNDVN